METIVLQPHPAAQPDAVEGVEVSIAREGRFLTLTYMVRGRAGVRMPDPVGLQRADELWRTTCFELFVRKGGGGYVEFNFSPSNQWATYAFSDYRSGMSDVAGLPVTEIQPQSMGLIAAIDLEEAGLPGQGPLRLGVCAVIEEASGTKSYWALAHPSDKPDFHHPDSFVLELA